MLKISTQTLNAAHNDHSIHPTKTAKSFLFRLVCDYGFIATGRTLFDCAETEEAAGQATCVETMAFVIGKRNPDKIFSLQ